MHPALSIPRLENFEKTVVKELLALGPTSQVRLLKRIPRVSQATLSRALARLAAQDIVEKTGTTRDAVFKLTTMAQYFARPAAQRPPVEYDGDRIDHYVPNETRWLPVAARDRMRQAAGLMEHRLDASTYSRRISERFLIDLAWASSRLEGNTYEYLEAEALIKFSETAEGHDWTEATMILNHKRAITLLLETVGTVGIEPGLLFRLHSLLMRDLLEPAALGRVRTTGAGIGIGGSSYRPCTDGHALTTDFGALCWAASEVQDPFEASFLLLCGTAYLQAFADGNKRTGRLVCNIPLLRAGFPPMSFLAVTPSEYISGVIAFYELGDPEPLADVISRAYAEAAPSYNAAMATQRTPRSAEIRHRARINKAVAAIVRASVEGDNDSEEAIMSRTLDSVAADDRDIVTESVRAALAAIGPMNFDAWDVPASDAEAYAQRRDLAREQRTGPGQ